MVNVFILHHMSKQTHQDIYVCSRSLSRNRCVCVKTEVKKWSVKCSRDNFISSQWVPAVKDIISLRTRPYTCTAHLSFHSSVLIKQRFQGVERRLEQTPTLHTRRVDLQVRWVPYRPRPLSFVNTLTSLTFQTRVQQSHKCTLTLRTRKLQQLHPCLDLRSSDTNVVTCLDWFESCCVEMHVTELKNFTYKIVEMFWAHLRKFELGGLMRFSELERFFFSKNTSCLESQSGDTEPGSLLLLPVASACSCTGSETLRM